MVVHLCTTIRNMLQIFNMLQKFLPLMGIDPDTMGTSPDSLISFENFQLNVLKKKQAEKKSNLPKYVCAKFGAAGLGALTDHGTKKIHGWEENDYKITQNHGRGAMLYAFRNFMMKNAGVPLKERKPCVMFVPQLKFLSFAHAMASFSSLDG